MWLLDLRLKSLNKIYFYYTDPTSVLPYGNIRCSIENRTKHGGTGVQMPLGQNQNICCRKNFEKVSVIHISSGRSHEQKKEMDVFNFSDKVTFVWNTRKSALVEKFLWQEKAVWYGTFFFFMIQPSHRESFNGFLTSPWQNLWAHFLDRRTDGKRWQGWPRLDWDGAWLDRISQWTERLLSICVTIACKSQSGMEKSGVYIRDGPT